MMNMLSEVLRRLSGDEFENELLLLSVALDPLAPLNAIALLIYLYRVLRRRLYAAVTPLALYLALRAVNPLVALAVLAGTALTSLALRRAFAKTLALALLAVIAGLVLNSGVYSAPELYVALREWVARGVNSYIPIYIASVLNAVIIYITYGGRDSLAKGSSPATVPTGLFMAFLTAAALLLALGREGDANRLAELAYYNLVIAVGLALVDTLKEK